MMSDHRTNVLAAREHELNNYALVFYHVRVEANLLIILRDQFDVWEMASLQQLARRDVLKTIARRSRRILLSRSRSCGCGRRRGAGCCEPSSACDFSHVLCLLGR